MLTGQKCRHLSSIFSFPSANDEMIHTDRSWHVALASEFKAVYGAKYNRTYSGSSCKTLHKKKNFQQNIRYRFSYQVPATCRSSLASIWKGLSEFPLGSSRIFAGRCFHIFHVYALQHVCQKGHPISMNRADWLDTFH